MSAANQFNPPSPPAIETIPDGYHDIATYLGIDPGLAYPDSNFAFSAASGMKFPEHAVGPLHQGITSLARKNARAVTLTLPNGLLDYQREAIGVGEIIEMPTNIPSNGHFIYPDHDIWECFRRSAQESEKARYQGAVLCPLMTSPETESLAEELGARTLVTSEQAYRFNSKVRVATQARHEGYCVPPHVVAYSADEIESQFRLLKKEVTEMGVNPQTSRFWIKFDNLAGGFGVLSYEPAKHDFTYVQNWISQTLEESNTPKERFIPIVMDLDISNIPGVVRVIENFNVQGVVGPQRVSMTGVTLQKTENGHYMGGAMPLSDEEKVYAEDARRWAFPVLGAAQRQGYRGYAGIDVILCEMQDGSLRGYVLEMNGRINSSTSLLSMVHFTARESRSGDATGCNISSAFSRPLADFRAYEKAFAPVLYRGARSGYAGIVPIILNQDDGGRLTKVKTIAVAPTRPILAEIEAGYAQIMHGLR